MTLSLFVTVKTLKTSKWTTFKNYLSVISIQCIICIVLDCKLYLWSNRKVGRKAYWQVRCSKKPCSAFHIQLHFFHFPQKVLFSPFAQLLISGLDWLSHFSVVQDFFVEEAQLKVIPCVLLIESSFGSWSEVEFAHSAISSLIHTRLRAESATVRPLIISAPYGQNPLWPVFSYLTNSMTLLHKIHFKGYACSQ